MAPGVFPKQNETTIMSPVAYYCNKIHFRTHEPQPHHRVLNIIEHGMESSFYYDEDHLPLFYVVGPVSKHMMRPTLTDLSLHETMNQLAISVILFILHLKMNFENIKLISGVSTFTYNSNR